METFLDYFEPENYNLDLTLNREKKELRGVATITGFAKSNVVKLHAVGLEIDSVFLNDQPTDFIHSNEVLSLSSSPQKLSLKIEYKTALSNDMEGAYLSTYQHDSKTETIVTTQFESHYARRAFPCVDEPAAKATFDLKIALEDYSPGDIILANTPIKSQSKNTAIFETTPRMSTYLLAFIAGKFHGKTVKNAHGVKITTYAPLNQPLDSVDFANEVAAKSLDFYDDEFGVPYPLKKCDQVALPDFEAGAMENWGLVTYRESMSLADKTATLDTKKSVALTVAHELSHQWFGDLVTMNWWDDLWLNESFASIMEYMAVDALYPEFNIWEDFFTGDCLAALKRDAYPDVQAVHQSVANVEDIANLFDGAIVYAKGARLMFMLIRQMGWENFKKGLKNYFEKYAYKNTVGDDLWNELTPFANFDVKTFMNAWISTPGYPVIANGSQKRFLLSKASGRKLESILRDSPQDDGSSAQRATTTIQDSPAPTGAGCSEARPVTTGASERVLNSSLALGSSEYPISTLLDDMSGHYLINLSEPDFNAKLANFNNLSLEQKLRLLIDRDFLMKSGEVPAASLIDLLENFKFETSPAVWSIIATIGGDLKLFVDPESESEKQLKKFVGTLVKPNLEKLGLEPKKSDSEPEIRLRNLLLALDFYAETPENLQKLAQKYSDDLKSLDSEIRSDILDAKIYLDPKILDVYLEKYQTEPNPDIKGDLLFAMTLTKDEENLKKLVSLLKKPEIIKPQNHLYLFIYLYRNFKARSDVFSWLTENWDYVKKMSGDKTIADYPRYLANMIKTDAEKSVFWGFFADKKSNPALVRTLKIAESEIDSRLALVAQNKNSVTDRLAKI